MKFYIAFWIEEPDVKAAHIKRDALIYADNDVELFVAGTDFSTECQPAD